MRSGVFALFESPDALLAAIAALRARGYSMLDAHTPYWISGLDDALRLERSRIPRASFAAGALGAIFAYGLQWWIHVVDYPLNVGAFPLHSPPSFIPITFETTILFAGLTAFVLAFVSVGLPRPYHPIFELEELARTSVDRFGLAIDGADPRFDPDRSRRELAELGAVSTAEFGGAKKERRS